jgi:hypothetical protein
MLEVSYRPGNPETPKSRILQRELENLEYNGICPKDPGKTI